MNLGERIYKLRSEKNLSQVDLAKILDVSRQSISQWENTVDNKLLSYLYFDSLQQFQDSNL